MEISRRRLVKMALSLSAAPWLLHFQSLAAPFTKMVKITDIKTLGLDNTGDGCLVRIDTDAGLTGYGEAGFSAPACRELRRRPWALTSSSKTCDSTLARRC